MYQILNVRVDSTSYNLATRQIIKWAGQKESRYVCIANVHMVMEAYDAPNFRQIVNESDLVTPDGMPLVWVMHRMGAKGQERVYGPELMLHVAEAAAREGIPVGLYGGTLKTLEKLAANLQNRYPRLQIAYRYSPPFQPLSPEEDWQITNEINRSGALILFVGLGCPKQERWMAKHKEHINAVMLGVGAAFDLHAGVKPQAPSWLQRAGLEWLFRLFIEPRRLWMRYLYHNPRFLVLAGLQLWQRSIH